MRNKKCPKEHRQLCDEENAKIDELFRFDCPEKRRYYECLKYEEHIRTGQVEEE